MSIALKWKPLPVLLALLISTCLVVMLVKTVSQKWHAAIEERLQLARIKDEEHSLVGKIKIKKETNQGNDEPANDIEKLDAIKVENKGDDQPVIVIANKESNKVKTQAITPFHTELIKWAEPNGPFNPADPGEGGQPFETKPEEEKSKNKAYAEYGFNQFISDKISLHRSLSDPRPQICKTKKYPNRLLRVSVVIIFHNEGWSTLLRTVHTTLDRSPPELLWEIVLCDDFSVKDHLKNRLEEYVSSLQKVKIVRTPQREGLIRARAFGADHTSGDVIIFLDSHCEVNVGWLPPLLAPITADYRTVTCPTIDFIDHNNFLYRGVDPFIRGTFNWRFDYKERGITAEQRAARKDEAEGVKSPVMAGGLFAISRKFWLELGKYDPGMYVWGGEQYEISFKLWMCGGQMLNQPCSRVGHVYRRNVPYTYDRPNAVLINFKRVAEVWMDDFKEFLYQRRPEIRAQATGDISDRRAIRDRNKCHDFRWYLKNVVNDTLRTKYEPDRGYGEIKNMKHNLCLDSMGQRSGGIIGLVSCHGQNGNQAFHWSYMYELRQNEEDCLDARYTNEKDVYTEKCHEMQGNQRFEYDNTTGQITHSGSGKCLAVAPPDERQRHPMLAPCDSPNREDQVWTLKTNDMNQPVPAWARFADDLKAG